MSSGEAADTELADELTPVVEIVAEAPKWEIYRCLRCLSVEMRV